MFAIVPQVFDLWQDPQERYDIFMNNYTEWTWTMATSDEAIKQIVGTYLKHRPRKLQSEHIPYITLPEYQLLQHVKEQLQGRGHRSGRRRLGQQQLAILSR